MPRRPERSGARASRRGSRWTVRRNEWRTGESVPGIGGGERSRRRTWSATRVPGGRDVADLVTRRLRWRRTLTTCRTVAPGFCNSIRSARTMRTYIFSADFDAQMNSMVSMSSGTPSLGTLFRRSTSGAPGAAYGARRKRPRSRLCTARAPTRDRAQCSIGGASPWSAEPTIRRIPIDSLDSKTVGSTRSELRSATDIILRSGRLLDTLFRRSDHSEDEPWTGARRSC